MATINTLIKAKNAKNDEFYTQITDIEKELKHYKEHFKGKTIFCNCDDPEYSNFWKYFMLNFSVLGLKKIIATHYEKDKPSYKLEYSLLPDEHGQITFDVIKTPLMQNGDFRSPECIEILKEADVIVTNPPFSLFRDYMAQLIEYNKKFIIIGNPNAIHYKEIFPLIRDNQIWLGYKTMSEDMLFDVNKEYAEWLVNNKKQGSGYKIIDGVIKGRSQAIWFTNLDTEKRHEDLLMYKTYSEDEYTKYYNYDAININRVNEIPVDYYGKMGVPESFLQSYNPNQFEIIGLGTGFLGQSIGVAGILPEHKKQMRGHCAAGDLYYIDENNKPKVPFTRIIIKRRG